MGRRYNQPPAGTGVLELIRAGVPAGPLARANYYWKAPSGSKYHATTDCNRLTSRSGWTQAGSVSVDLTHTPDAKFCLDCVSGPTDSTGRRYRDDARKVHAAARNLAVVLLRVHADQRQEAVSAEEEKAAKEIPVSDLVNPPVLHLDHVTRTTWARVTEAKAVRQLIASVSESPTVHPDMSRYAAATYEAAVALHERLEHLATAATDGDSVLRGCVVDLLGDLPSNDTADKITAPVSDPDTYPAICTHYHWGTKATGFKDTVQSAWVAWSDQVKLDGDLAAARQAAQSAGSVADLEPEHVAQMPKSPARTPVPESGSPWAWLTAEWRLAATEELSAIIGEWETSYAQAMTESKAESAQVLGLSEWSLEARTAVNASTELLARLQVTADPDKEYALLLADGPVARWLGEFGLKGRRYSGWSSSKGTVEPYGDATVNDSAATFATALRMWEPDTDRRPGPRSPMTDLKQVLDIARGIHVTHTEQDETTLF